MAGMLVDRPGTPCVGWGGGEVKVVSIETRGQPDAGWLAATLQSLYYIHLDTFNAATTQGLKKKNICKKITGILQTFS